MAETKPQKNEEILTPADLDPAAVFPQCLDNQFVSREVFQEIVSSNGTLDFYSPEIDDKRARHTRTEFIRSLIYSPQVVINRAFLKNCRPLYRFYLPNDPWYDPEVFPLFKEGALIPYLFSGDALFSDGAFSMDDEGDRACAHLMEECGSAIRFMRLSSTSDGVRSLVAEVSQRFETMSGGLTSTAENTELFPRMFGELFEDRFAEDANSMNRFRKFLRDFRVLVRGVEDIRDERLQESEDTKQADLPWLTRQTVYSRMLIRQCSCGAGSLQSTSCSCVARGRFQAPSDPNGPEFSFGAKCLVDLVYNSGIPDHATVQRFTFTPQGLPTRNALQDYAIPDPSHQGSVDDLARSIFQKARIFHSATSQAMVLPALGDLGMGDVRTIRSSEQWQRFNTILNTILENPVAAAAHFEAFQSAFEDLQRAVSDHYIDHHVRPRGDSLDRLGRYKSWVSAAFRVGGDIIRIGVQAALPNEADFSDRWAVDRVVRKIRNAARSRVAVGPARLLFEVFDVRRERAIVDSSRSWSVDLMRKQVAWEVPDALDFLEAIKGNVDEASPVNHKGGVANAG